MLTFHPLLDVFDFKSGFLFPEPVSPNSFSSLVSLDDQSPVFLSPPRPRPPLVNALTRIRSVMALAEAPILTFPFLSLFFFKPSDPGRHLAFLTTFP